jgi:hypothetical protein
LLSASAAAAPPRVAWTQTYGLVDKASARSEFITGDSEGNVIFGGIQSLGVPSEDVLIAKFTPSGEESWRVIYDGAGYRDFLLGMALGSDGRLAAFGSSALDSNQNQRFYWLNEYDAQGVLLWQTKPEFFSTLLGGQVRTDADGNIYVVLESTIRKYDSQSTELWSTHADQGQLGGYVLDVCLDTDGNVIGTGVINQGHGRIDSLLVKIDSEGKLVWQSVGALTDEPLKVAVASNGRIAVATRGLGAALFDAEGVLLWEAPYDDPATDFRVAQGVAIHADGTVYVQGTAFDSFAPAGTLAAYKLEPDGSPAWYWSHDLGGLIRDLSQVQGGMNLDPDGNLTVTGGFNALVTTRLDAQGAVLWSVELDGDGEEGASGVVRDAAGNLYVAGWTATEPDGGQESGVVIKYDSQGANLHTSTIEGTAAAFEEPIDLELDIAGNAVVLVRTSLQTLATVQYSAAGELQWSHEFAEGASDVSVALAVTRDGVVVTGEEDGSIAIVAYSSEGDDRWQQVYRTETRSEPFWLEPDSEGNVYVGGITYVGDGRGDWTILKLNPAGEILWDLRLPSGVGRPIDFAVDLVGDVHMMGMNETVPTLRKVSTSGDESWSIPPELSSGTRPVAIALDFDSNVFLAATTRNPVQETAKNVGMLVKKYSPDGEFLTEAALNSAGALEESVDIATVQDGSVVLAGVARNQDRSKMQFLVAKWSNDLELLWGSPLETGSGTPEKLRTLAMGPEGEVVVSGERGSATSGFSPMTAKLSAAGETRWIALADGVKPGQSLGPQVRVAADGDVVLALELQGNVVTLRYDETLPHFLRADANADAQVNLADVIAGLSYLFAGGPAPDCLASADVDDSGRIEITDSIFLLRALFLGIGTVPAPYPSCGEDPTPDDLSCLAECEPV